MKSIFKKILFSFVLLVLIVAVAEYSLYRMNGLTYQSLANTDYFKPFLSFDNNFDDFLINHFRPVENEKSSENPIVIFGCSYAYGDNIGENKTFSHNLAKYTKSPVYNFAMGGFGVQHLFYLLNKKEMQNRYFNVIKEPKYVFYVYVPVQNVRLYEHIFIPLLPTEYLNYNIKTLKRVQYPEIFYRSFILKNIDILIASKKEKDLKLNEKYLVRYFSATKEIMQKNWKNTKYCILYYGEPFYFDLIKDVADKSGWNLVNLDDFVDGNITDEKYCLNKIDRHPNGYLWEVLSPVLAKNLNL